MRIILFLVTLHIFTGCLREDKHAQMALTDGSENVDVNKKNDEETISLGREYKLLRSKPSYFRNGNWDDDIDKFGGRMHILLQELGKRVSDSDYSKAQLIDLMGNPDSIRNDDGKEILIYFWRGWHDYLYFFSNKGKTLNANWYFAGE
jgi:hypothetical protein